MNIDIESVIAAYFTNMGAMNPEGWTEIFAEDGLVYDPVGKPPTKPREDAKDFFVMLSRFFSKLEIVKEQTFIAGNGAAVKWTMQVVAKNGRVASSQGISVFEINDNGKIQKVSSYWDEAKMMSELKDS